MCQFWEPCLEAGETKWSVSLNSFDIGSLSQFLQTELVPTSFIAFVVGCMQEVCRVHDNSKASSSESGILPAVHHEHNF